MFQNVVYPDEEHALAAPRATFLLVTCATCGFSYNGVFEPALVVYDSRYDNAVPSLTFKDYYRSLAVMMAERFNLSSGKVIDVGCGKGEFLRVLCEVAPGIEGIGIDPSCEAVKEERFKLIADTFNADHFKGDTKLVILRHVLEHIPEPADFLRELRMAAPETPLYVEVPELGWIQKNNVFWDFCYEHCNYFTLDSLAICLQQAGYSVVEQSRSFGDQYQWAIAEPSSSVSPPAYSSDAAVRAASLYAALENEQIARFRKRAQDRKGIILWGMSTKGVITAVIIGKELVLGGVDVNPLKQGRFAAGSAVQIHPPEWTARAPAGTPVLVMNPNYRGEIAEQIEIIGAEVELIDL